MKISEVKKRPDGTYAGLKFCKETTGALTGYVHRNRIPNVLPAKKMHVTLLYSRKHLPDFKARGELETPLVGKPIGFEIFESSPDKDQNTTNCLVLRFECPELVERHNELMDGHDATFDYDEYKPHLTVSYDVGDLNPKLLPKFDKDLIMTEEYGQDLDLSWAEKNAKR